MKYNILAIKETIGNNADEFAERVEPLYKKLKWTWHDEPNSPTKQDIIKNINQLVNDIGDKPRYISSGGIEVGYSVSNETIEIILRFIYDDYTKYFSKESFLK